MDIKLRDRNFAKVAINKKRSFYWSIYEIQTQESKDIHKVVFHTYFTDRIKVYDLDALLNLQKTAIMQFLDGNKLNNNKNTIFYMLIESKKGLAFTPDFRALKLFTENKFKLESDLQITLGQIVGIIPKFYSNLFNVFSNNYFGMQRGIAYEIVSNYSDALKSILKFNELITYDKLPDPVKSGVSGH